MQAEDLFFSLQLFNFLPCCIDKKKCTPGCVSTLWHHWWAWLQVQQITKYLELLCASVFNVAFTLAVLSFDQGIKNFVEFRTLSVSKE